MCSKFGLFLLPVSSLIFTWSIFKGKNEHCFPLCFLFFLLPAQRTIYKAEFRHRTTSSEPQTYRCNKCWANTSEACYECRRRLPVLQSQGECCALLSKRWLLGHLSKKKKKKIKAVSIVCDHRDYCSKHDCLQMIIKNVKGAQAWDIRLRVFFT